jgi:hypothetical protein
LDAIQNISLAEVAKDAPKEYVLSIKLSLNGLSFLIHKGADAVHMTYYEWSKGTHEADLKNFKEILNENEWTRPDYSKILIFIYSPHSFIIPEALTQQQLSTIYSSYLGIEGQHVLTQKLKTGQLVFGIPEETFNLFQQFYPNAEWKHCSASFIAQGLETAKHKEEVFVNHHHGYFEILAVKNTKLNAHNYFHYSDTEEYLFKLLSFVKQTGMDINQMHLHLLGMINKSSKLHQAVEKYIPNVIFEAISTERKEDVFKPFIEAVNYENR